ncbi:glucose-1-phosphate thymidylyltransferase RfbA [Micromonospora sp. NPDC007230]|uniref:glucose-1-phosphate thymidylyltransferase RfbA n=1 Tax=Micromonospora sp. NPDC007230 TaxID=3364237 RepID=UPI0036A1A5E7
MRGILLAGGTGSRLWPITKSVSKHLMPVHDKPMIFYPLSTLLNIGIREILVITAPTDRTLFHRLLGDGSQWGLRLEYAVQPEPEGIAQALTIGEDFLGGLSSALILGDNLFHGMDFGSWVRSGVELAGGHVFAYPVDRPSDYGVVELDADGRVLSLQEKPAQPRSRYAVPGLYFYDTEVTKIARTLRPSPRGELEITAINDYYLRERTLRVTVMDRGSVWLDMGTVADMVRASEYVRVVEERQNIKVGCIEEAAWRAGFIDDAQLRTLAQPLMSSGYGEYLLRLLG